MKKAICNLPLIPLRLEPSECSEMITQLLFGELVEVMDENGSWSQIRNLADKYVGWCSTKMLQLLPDTVFERLKESVPVLTRELLSPCNCSGETCPSMFLPAGSRLYDLNPATGEFPLIKVSVSGNPVDSELWRTNPDFLLNQSASADRLVEIASRFLNAPYLWGGKSILGMDCSGLVQLVFSLCGVALPRDARDQARYGEPVPYLSLSLIHISEPTRPY
jgi:hypothetical protein